MILFCKGKAMGQLQEVIKAISLRAQSTLAILALGGIKGFQAGSGVKIQDHMLISYYIRQRFGLLVLFICDLVLRVWASLGYVV